MSKYYCIGNDEYNFYKSIDNGRNWSLITDGNGDVQGKDQRIIIYGKSNDGLKYTDDNFATIKESNVLDGNWDPVVPENETTVDALYSVSLDNRGIYKSVDHGENWDFFAAGNGDKLNGDKIYGNGNVTDLDGNLFSESTINASGQIIQMLIDGKSVGDCLIYILNKIIIPQLTNMLTGQNDSLFFYDYFNKEKDIYPSFYTDGEIYKIQENGVDFINDVGMRPLSLEYFKEYNAAKMEIQESLSEEEDKEKKLLDLLNNKNSKFYKTFKIVEKALNIHKDFLLNKTVKKIFEKKENYEGLDQPNDIEYMKAFYNIQKGTEASVTGTIINAAFTFSISKKVALIKTSIIEVARQMKDSINLSLNLLSDKILSGYYTYEELINNKWANSLFIFNLKKEWAMSLNNCIKDYYIKISNNINNITKDEDREFINISANRYNTNKNIYVRLISDKLNEWSIFEPDYIKLFNDKLINNFVNNFKNPIESLISQSLPAEETKTKCLDILNNYCSIEENDIKEASSKYNGYSNEIINEFKDIANSLDLNENGLKNEDLEGLSQEDQDLVFNYFNEIATEFKNRCGRLMEISNKKVLESFNIYLNIKDDLTTYTEKLINNLDHYEKFANEYNLNYFVNKFKSNNDIFVIMVKEYWLGMRGLI